MSEDEDELLEDDEEVLAALEDIDDVQRVYTNFERED